ncbi:MAG: hypothetical protein JXA90_17200 [Planctomycetes bacterium]|nr:hypothetical protein [Planctomycetota bacterium]
MANIRVRVENGKIVGEAPPGVEEGEEFEISIADPGDDMTDEDLARLNAALDEAWRAVREGRARPAEDVLRDLHSKR